MKFKPLYDRVLIKRTAEQEKTAGGILLPDSAKEKPHEGTVLAVGDGGEKKLTVQVGDKVLFSKYSGTEVTIDGEELVIMKEEEILGIIK